MTSLSNPSDEALVAQETASDVRPSMLTDSGVHRRLDQFWNRPSPVEGEDGREADVFGPYRVEKVLGYGAFGVVYRASKIDSVDLVAIKLPRPEVLLDAEKNDRFMAEATAARRLSHPNIVRVLDAQLDGPIPYIVSEYCEGPDLAKWLEQHQASEQGIEEIVDFLLQVIDAVAYAHSEGVIHRDIKPSNILLKAKNDVLSGVGEDLRLASFQPKLTDFGLSKVFDTPLVDSRSSVVLGTPMYMAPEQILSRWGQVTQATDVFAVGMLLFELLQGRPLRQNQTYTDIVASLVNGGNNKLESIRPDCPDRLKAILNRCLAIDPLDRYSSMDQLRQDLLGRLDSRERKLGRESAWFQKLTTWVRDPDRARQICAYVIPLHVCLLVWMLTCLAASPLLDGIGFGLTDVIQVLAICLVNNLGLIGLAVLRLQGHRWATPIALAISLVGMVAVPILAILDWIPSFEKVYQGSPYFDVVTHGQILIFGIVQSCLLIASLICDQAQRLRSKISSEP